MFRGVQLFAVFFAWLLATGAQWDLLQVVAWSNMFVSNSASMSVGNALGKTFDGEECEMCRAIRQAKQQENPPGLPSEKRMTKFPLIHQPVATFTYQCPEPGDWTFNEEFMVGLTRERPPVPPPRSS